MGGLAQNVCKWGVEVETGGTLMQTLYKCRCGERKGRLDSSRVGDLRKPCASWGVGWGRGGQGRGTKMSLVQVEVGVEGEWGQRDSCKHCASGVRVGVEGDEYVYKLGCEVGWGGGAYTNLVKVVVYDRGLGLWSVGWRVEVVEWGEVGRVTWVLWKWWHGMGVGVGLMLGGGRGLIQTLYKQGFRWGCLIGRRGTDTNLTRPWSKGLHKSPPSNPSSTHQSLL